MFSIDWTFRGGDILIFVSGLTVAASFLYNRGKSEQTISAAITALQKDYEGMQQELKQLGQIMTQLALQKQTTDLLFKWYDELRNGIGLIKK